MSVRLALLRCTIEIVSSSPDRLIVIRRKPHFLKLPLKQGSPCSGGEAIRFAEVMILVLDA